MKSTFTNLCLVFSLFICNTLNAQKIEAESGVLDGGAVVVTNASSSGGKYVTTNAGNITISTSTATTGFYNVYIYVAAPYGDKQNNFILDGNSAVFATPLNTNYIRLKVISSQKVNAGSHTIKITNSWGYINVDYIEFEAVDASSRFNVNKTLVTPNPTKEAACLYQFLYDNYGKKILSGVMTLNSFDESNFLKQNTGKEPVVLGIDFLHTNRKYTWYNDQTPVDDAKAWSAKNGIPVFCWHWRDPSRATESFYTQKGNATTYTTFDIKKINDPASTEYKAMLSDIDYTATLLKSLQTANIPVIWRPLHEAAGGWFWWGADGASCKKLYQIMYDRMVNFHGLKNLIWVWTREPNDEAFYPGDAYVDIVGRDIYKDGDHGSQVIEFNNLNTLYGGKKMITISESGSFPDVTNLINDGAGWSWWMPWYGGYTESATYNSLDLWKKMFASDYVITLDEMPNYKNCTLVSGIEEEVSESKGLKIYFSEATGNVIVNSPEVIGQLTIFNTLGEIVIQKSVNSTNIEVPALNLKSGIYLVKADNKNPVKIFKQ
ncbi:MAG: T9SS type A sorting domain-containing protein [Opitutaceae bacterium]|nr:T9SS type A sorting domain-containing protein [Cytophagales bacterium]